MKKYDVIVIGGGASGLMAAGKAASNGADTLLLEKMNRPARKLLITGKGRCNLTNVAPLDEFISHFGETGKFLRPSFSEFFSNDLIDFLKKRNIETITERGGRVFPKDGDARHIAGSLINWVTENGVTIQNQSPVESLITGNGYIQGVIIKNPDGTSTKLHSKSVIIATGGTSYPATGSSGEGYILAEKTGHKIVKVRPALVPLVTEGDTAKKLQGVSLKNVAVRVYIDGKRKGEGFGEMLFTHFGLSGPVILTLSGEIVDALEEKKKVEVSIDLKPALDDTKLDNRLQRDIKENSKKKFGTVLKELLPMKMIDVCAQLTGISSEKPANQITAEERTRLRLWLKDFRFKIKGHRSFSEAIITAGGVNTREINPSTMESKLVKGLFFAGEVMDISADTGGYNLQAAFSTGMLAGRCAAEFSMGKI